jgi:hypothetical protein
MNNGYVGAIALNQVFEPQMKDAKASNLERA